MTTATIEKRVNILESRQLQPDFVPARWLFYPESREPDTEIDEQYRKEEEDHIDIQEQEAEERRRGFPEWIILLTRENRADYYERKAKREAEA